MILINGCQRSVLMAVQHSVSIAMILVQVTYVVKGNFIINDNNNTNTNLSVLCITEDVLHALISLL